MAAAASIQNLLPQREHVDLSTKSIAVNSIEKEVDLSKEDLQELVCLFSYETHTRTNIERYIDLWERFNSTSRNFILDLPNPGDEASAISDFLVFAGYLKEKIIPSYTTSEDPGDFFRFNNKSKGHFVDLINTYDIYQRKKLERQERLNLSAALELYREKSQELDIPSPQKPPEPPLEKDSDVSQIVKDIMQQEKTSYANSNGRNSQNSRIHKETSNLSNNWDDSIPEWLSTRVNEAQNLSLVPERIESQLPTGEPSIFGTQTTRDLSQSDRQESFSNHPIINPGRDYATSNMLLKSSSIVINESGETFPFEVHLSKIISRLSGSQREAILDLLYPISKVLSGDLETDRKADIVITQSFDDESRGNSSRLLRPLEASVVGVTFLDINNQVINPGECHIASSFSGGSVCIAPQGTKHIRWSLTIDKDSQNVAPSVESFLYSCLPESQIRIPRFTAELLEETKNCGGSRREQFEAVLEGLHVDGPRYLYYQPYDYLITACGRLTLNTFEELMIGECWKLAHLYSLILNKAGFFAVEVDGYNPRSNEDHAQVLVIVDGELIVVDPTHYATPLKISSASHDLIRQFRNTAKSFSDKLPDISNITGNTHQTKKERKRTRRFNEITNDHKDKSRQLALELQQNDRLSDENLAYRRSAGHTFKNSVTISEGIVERSYALLLRKFDRALAVATKGDFKPLTNFLPKHRPHGISDSLSAKMDFKIIQLFGAIIEETDPNNKLSGQFNQYISSCYENLQTFNHQISKTFTEDSITILSRPKIAKHLSSEFLNELLCDAYEEAPYTATCSFGELERALSKPHNIAELQQYLTNITLLMNALSPKYSGSLDKHSGFICNILSLQKNCCDLPEHLLQSLQELTDKLNAAVFTTIPTFTNKRIEELLFYFLYSDLPKEFHEPSSLADKIDWGKVDKIAANYFATIVAEGSIEEANTYYSACKRNDLTIITIGSLPHLVRSFINISQNAKWKPIASPDNARPLSTLLVKSEASIGANWRNLIDTLITEYPQFADVFDTIPNTPEATLAELIHPMVQSSAVDIAQVGFSLINEPSSTGQFYPVTKIKEIVSELVSGSPKGKSLLSIARKLSYFDSSMTTIWGRIKNQYSDLFSTIVSEIEASSQKETYEGRFLNALCTHNGNANLYLSAIAALSKIRGYTPGLQGSYPQESDELFRIYVELKNKFLKDRSRYRHDTFEALSGIDYLPRYLWDTLRQAKQSDKQGFSLVLDAVSIDTRIQQRYKSILLNPYDDSLEKVDDHESTVSTSQDFSGVDVTQKSNVSIGERDELVMKNWSDSFSINDINWRATAKYQNPVVWKRGIPDDPTGDKVLIVLNPETILRNNFISNLAKIVCSAKNSMQSGVVRSASVALYVRDHWMELPIPSDEDSYNEWTHSVSVILASIHALKIDERTLPYSPESLFSAAHCPLPNIPYNTRAFMVGWSKDSEEYLSVCVQLRSTGNTISEF